MGLQDTGSLINTVIDKLGIVELEKKIDFACRNTLDVFQEGL